MNEQVNFHLNEVPVLAGKKNKRKRRDAVVTLFERRLFRISAGLSRIIPTEIFRRFPQDFRKVCGWNVDKYLIIFV